jgi:hypothetical protein
MRSFLYHVLKPGGQMLPCVFIVDLSGGTTEEFEMNRVVNLVRRKILRSLLSGAHALLRIWEALEF